MAFVRISAFLLLISAVAVFHSAQGAIRDKIGSKCVGCYQKISPNDPALKKTLNMALSSANAENYTVLKILSAVRQVVNGFNYKVEFKAEAPGQGILRCKIAYLQKFTRKPGSSTIVRSFRCK